MKKLKDEQIKLKDKIFLLINTIEKHKLNNKI